MFPNNFPPIVRTGAEIRQYHIEHGGLKDPSVTDERLLDVARIMQAARYTFRTGVENDTVNFVNWLEGK